MKTFLAAAFALGAGSVAAATVADVRSLAEPSAGGLFHLTYDGGTDRLIASTADLAGPLASIDARVAENGDALASTARDLAIENDAFETAALGRLLDVRLSSGLIELLFRTSDEAPGDGEDWGPFALATLLIAGFDPTSGLGSLDAGAAVEAQGEIASAVVPLPAAAPLLAAALALVAAFGRRRV